MKEISKIILNRKLEVTNTGKVYRIKNGLKNEVAITYTSRNNRYGIVTYYENGKQTQQYVHRLIAKAFIPNPENKPEVNHIDGNTKNNNSNNLEWVTSQENTIHAYKNKLIDPQAQQPKCVICGKITRNKNRICKSCKEKQNNR